jgi:hypothetical protein
LKEELEKLIEESFRYDPCYLPAVLKLSTELKGEKSERLDNILEDTLSEFSISREDFQKYIDEHRLELEAEARKLNF